MSVLVVDDNEAVRSTSADVLRSAGFAADEAESAASALDMLEAQPFDIALIEVNACQPGEVERLNRLEPRPAIIFVSSQGLAEQSFEVQMSSNYRFLRKPVRPVVLIHAVTESLGIKAS